MPQEALTCGQYVKLWRSSANSEDNSRKLPTQCSDKLV